MQDFLGGWLHQERKKIYAILKKKSLQNNKRVILKWCNTLATSSSSDKYDKPIILTGTGHILIIFQWVKRNTSMCRTSPNLNVSWACPSNTQKYHPKHGSNIWHMVFVHLTSYSINICHVIAKFIHIKVIMVVFQNFRNKWVEKQLIF